MYIDHNHHHDHHDHDHDNTKLSSKRKITFDTSKKNDGLLLRAMNVLRHSDTKTSVDCFLDRLSI